MNQSNFADVCRKGDNIEFIKKFINMQHFDKAVGSIGLYNCVLGNNSYICEYIINSGKFYFDDSYRQAICFGINNNFGIYSLLMNKLEWLSPRYISVLFSYDMDDEYRELFVKTYIRTTGSGLELVKYLKTLSLDYRKYSQFI